MMDVEIILLSNQHTIPGRGNVSIHAECNVAYEFPALGTDEDYIGVSRLCCGFCDAVLNMYAYKHRGTHGICEAGWKHILLQFQDIAKSL